MSQKTITPRRARLYVTRVDPWSVTKAAFLLSLTVAVVLVVAVVETATYLVAQVHQVT